MFSELIDLGYVWQTDIGVDDLGARKNVKEVGIIRQSVQGEGGPKAGPNHRCECDVQQCSFESSIQQEKQLKGMKWSPWSFIFGV